MGSVRLLGSLILTATALLAAGCSSNRSEAAPPAPADPNLIELGAEATASLVLADTPSQLAVRVRVAAGQLPGGDRPPLNLVLVLDTSGSMIGESIADLREAARDLVRRLSPRDRLAVVAFHSHAEVVVTSGPVSPLRRVWADLRLHGLEARGTTDLAGGLALGLSMIELGRQVGGVDRIVLLGDGVPNDGAMLPGLIAQARSSHVAITTLGLGVEFDEELLGRIALDTGGGYHFIADATTMAQVFDDELVRMKEVVARNVIVTLQPGPGITLEAVPGLDGSGNNRVAWLGDLAAGEIRDVIIPLTATGHRAGVAIELLDVTLSYDDAVGGSGAQHRAAFVATASSSDPVAVAAAVKLPLEVARRRATAASAILDAIRRARGGDVAGGLALLRTAEGETRLAALALHDPELDAIADRMAELGKSLAQITVATAPHAAPPIATPERHAAPRVSFDKGAGVTNEPAKAHDVRDEVVIRQAHQQANDLLRN